MAEHDTTPSEWLADNVAVTRLAIRHAPLSLLLLDSDGIIVAVSAVAGRLLHAGEHQLIGRSFADLVAEDDRAGLDSHLRSARRRSGHQLRMNCGFVRDDGLRVRMALVTEGISDPVLDGFTVVTLEAPSRGPGTFAGETVMAHQLAIHELMTASAPPEQVLDALAVFVEQHLQGICLVAVRAAESGSWELRVEASPSATSLLGISVASSPPRAELVPAVPHVCERPGDDPLVAELERREPGRVASAWVLPVAGPSDGRVLGSIQVLLDSPRPVTEADRDLCRVVSRVAGLVLERQRDDRWVQEQTLFDPLTQLAKRSLIVDRSEQALRRISDGLEVAALHLTSQDFHLVNTAYGHARGDDVLVQVARRIVEVVGETGTVARISGSSFAVLVEGTDPLALASELRDRLALAYPVDGVPREVHLDVRIGIADGRTADSGHTLLRNAYTACQRAKLAGNAPVVVYDPAFHAASLDQLSLRGDLQRSVGHGELRVEYQPKVDLRSGALAGAEALLRWEHPEHGRMRPDQFISLAEETGVIVDIGEWVLNEAVARCARWRAEGVIGEHFLLAVNMSARQLWTPDFGDRVAAILRSHDWDPAHLSLELTETVLVSDYRELLVALDRLKGLGVLLAADDFGTGYSALSYLDQLPLDILKVDRGFVARLSADGTGSVVATGVVKMAQELGLRTCGEGVESDGQYAGLRALGCDWAQGYLIARPLPADDFAQFAGSGGVSARS